MAQTNSPKLAVSLLNLEIALYLYPQCKVILINTNFECIYFYLKKWEGKGGVYIYVKLFHYILKSFKVQIEYFFLGWRNDD